MVTYLIAVLFKIVVDTFSNYSKGYSTDGLFLVYSKYFAGMVTLSFAQSRFARVNIFRGEFTGEFDQGNLTGEIAHGDFPETPKAIVYY